MKKFLSLILILIACINSILATSPGDSCRILFIGSSYFNYHNLTALFENLADSSEIEVYIDQRIPSGLYLSDHASSSETEAKINEKKWDYIFLQGVGRLTAYPQFYSDHPVYPALVTLRNKISANCDSTKMVFCLPWAYEDGMTWLPGWTDTYEDMQIKIYDNTLQWSDDIGFVISPVGWAWYAVLDENNYPLHYLHMSDWNHPSLRGSYLMACVIYSTVFLESSINIPYYGGLPEHEAIYFQTVASNIVLDSLDLWHITSQEEYQEELLIPHKFQIYQNYPNPFNPFTTIPFSIERPGFVTLKVYDVLGREIETIVNQYQNADTYSIKFNGSDLSSGIYFYKLQFGDEYSEIKKMMIMR